MKLVSRLLALALLLGILVPLGVAQDRSDKKEARPENDLVKKMMAFDKNKDGKLTREEVTDVRLHRVFDRADANKDGIVTKAELESLAAQEATLGDEGRGGGGKGGKGGKGGPGEGGFRRGPGGQPGVVLDPMLQEVLQLTEKQKKDLEVLQNEVDARLEKLLTAKQWVLLKEMRERRGLGGREGDGGRGGRGKGGKGKSKGGTE